jgi:hypothetical protein
LGKRESLIKQTQTLRGNKMKTSFAIVASIILVISLSANADEHKADQSHGKKTPANKTESIENLLAEKNLEQGKIVKRIRTQNIDTWRRLDNHHILIESKGRNKDFLIEFRNRCNGTRNRSTLIYKTTNNELTKFDSIGVLDTFISSQDLLRPTRTCSIKEIYQLNKLEKKTQTKANRNTQNNDAKKEVGKETALRKE